jgi:hypothetical protein
MATYAPPTEDLTIFNPDVFLIGGEGADFLAFPVAQGAETFPFGLSTTTLLAAGAISTSGTLTAGASTLDGASYSAGTSPAYEIEYPVNSGRFDFYTNTAGGARTRGAKIDATGVHTHNHFDTIDETAGILNIGTAATRTGAINIGTGGTSTRTTTIGFQASGNTLNLNGGAINIQGSGGLTTSITNTGILNLSNGNASAINIGSNKTGGNIDIGQSGGTASTTTINIGTGTSQTGAINIGTGATSALPITIGGFGGGTTTVQGSTLTLNGSTITMGASQTGGSITIGQSGGSASTTTIAIGNGSNQTGAINIGTGTATAKAITVGNVSGAFGTLNLGCASISIANASNTTALNVGTGMTSGALRIGGTTGGTTTIDIATGNSQTGAINIGTGSGEKTIIIGTAGGTPSSTTRLRGNTIELNPAVSVGALELGANMTGGLITIGGTTGGSTTIDIGTGNSQTGAIEIGTGTSAKAITIGNTNGGTITIARPIAPTYLPSAIGATNIGHLATPTASSITAITTSNGNLGQFDIGVGVWDINAKVRITGVTAHASNFFRLSLSTSSATQSTYTNDWLADNATGACNFLVNGRFSLSATTTIYVVGVAGGGVAASTTSNVDVQALRIA